MVARGGAYFGAGNGSIFLDSVVCTGTEDRLTDCPASTEHTCGHSQDAGVQCEGEILCMIYDNDSETIIIMIRASYSIDYKCVRLYN